MMKSLANLQNKEEILRRLKSIHPESRRLWGKMSAHQMICHLNDAFRIALGEKSVRPRGNILHRKLLKPFALYVPLQWPKGFPTMPEADQLKGGTRPIEFDRDVRELELLLERFIEKARATECHPHPIFGKMSERDFLRWAYLHMDHHFRQFGA